MSELLSIKELTKYYPIQRGVFSRTVGYIKAVDDISFTIKAGETLGLVGESGCGKSTTGKSILRLTEPTTGSILFNGVDITHLDDQQMRNKRKDMQMIFQDPYASLNPRKSIEQIIEEPLIIHDLGSKTVRKRRVRELLSLVGLSAEYGKRYPHQFSGGQRQRIGIARALAVQPKLIIADEPVSALDVSIQSQVLNLLKDLQVQFNLTYLFIAHDLSVVRHISDRVGVMYLGRVVELADTDALYRNPKHPYTQALLSAVPIPDPEAKRNRILLVGDIPSPANPPSGCSFHTRCIHAMEQCKTDTPELKQQDVGHHVACHLY